MPPPLPQQQGSRAGLITAVVVFVILWLVFTVFYFQERGRREQAENNEKAVVEKFKGIAPTDLSDPHLVAAREALKDDLTVDSAFELERKRRESLARVITGQSGIPAATAKQFAEGALNKSQEILKSANIAPGDLGLTVSQTDSLALTLEKFAAAIVKKDAEKKAADAKTDAAQKQIAALAAQHKTAMDSKIAEVQTLQAQVAARQADLDVIVQKQATAMQEVGANTSQQITELTNAKTAAEAALLAANQQIPPLRSQIEVLRKALATYRMDPRDNAVRLADGVITRVPGDGTVYINLGSTDAIPAGITFEVFDKDRGIPGLTVDIEGLDDDSARRMKDASEKLANAVQQLPTGLPGATGATATERYDRLPDTFKASIEVVSPGPGTSKCRIISIQPGAVIREGDLIANLVYNKNVKFKFALYGDFDLDYNGIPTPADTGTVRRLINQWGGSSIPINTVEDLTPNLDFIVMGVRPSVPVLSPEDMADAVLIQQVEQAKAAALRYDTILDKARDFSIPVLNQTRFLYYTGYFDQRTR